jgi:hypothetical protein
MSRFVLLLAAAALLGAAAVQGADAKIVSFRMPSKNIACAYINERSISPPFLRCDVLSGLKPKPRGRCREGDWAAVEMGRLARARAICISDTVYSNRAPVLRYGRTWRKGGFTCVSRRTGLTCRNLRRHGFFVSRSSWRVY